jgi:hypothetical protein
VSREADYRDLGRFGVLVHVVAEAMTSEDWPRIRDSIVEHGSRLRYLIVWADGSLTPTQRQESQQIQAAQGYLTLIFTESAISRGVGKVLEWFGVKLRMESKAKLGPVLEELGATRDEIDSVRQTIHDLEAEMRADSLRSRRTGTADARRKAR